MAMSDVQYNELGEEEEVEEKHEEDTSSLDSKERECRICGSTDRESGWLAPCACTGSMSMIHKHCLQKWITTRGQSSKAMECEVCHVAYDVKIERSVMWDAEHICTCRSCSHVAEACILLFCLGCLVVMMFVLFPSFESSDSTEKTLLIILFSVTVIMSGFALRKVFVRWRRQTTELVITSGRTNPNTPHPALAEAGESKKGGDAGAAGAGAAGAGGAAAAVAEDEIITGADAV